MDGSGTRFRLLIGAQVTSLPTLLAFSRQQPRNETRVTNVRQLTDRAFLTRWIEEEARKGDSGGSGNSVISRLFGQ